MKAHVSKEELIAHGKQCQELQCTHDLQRALDMGVKTQRTFRSVLGMKWTQLSNV